MVTDGNEPEATALRSDSPAGTQESDEREVVELREQVRTLKTQLKRERRLGLVWEDKPEDVVTRCQSEYPVLVEVPARAVTPLALSDCPTNYLIEGDNYPALAALNCTHAGAVDLIYIDPPYNTGNKDFTYNDHYVDAKDAYRHSKWLSFMEKRLQLAWSLLSPRGAIFISIDDDEHAHLKLLCDAVFGPAAFISNIVWQKKYTQSNDADHFSDTHDFILCYAKPGFNTGRLRRTDKQKGRYTNPDNDPRGPWKAVPLHARSGTDDAFTYAFKNGASWSPPAGTFPRFTPDNLRVADDEGRIWFGANGTAKPSMKRYLAEMADEVVPTTIWLHSDVGHNDEARRELKEHFPNNPFATPKPTRLIKRILELASQPDSLVLDFFAGSGTTGQAVIEFNAQDGGNRRFIVSTNNEGGIAEDICYPRLCNVIAGYGEGKNRPEGIPANLRYYRVGSVPTTKADGTPRSLDALRREFAARLTDTLCFAEDAHASIASDEDFSLFASQERYVAVVRDIDGIQPLITALNGIPDERPVRIYIQSYGADGAPEDFEEVSRAFELKATPDDFLSTYRDTFHRRTTR